MKEEVTITLFDMTAGVEMCSTECPAIVQSLSAWQEIAELSVETLFRIWAKQDEIPTDYVAVTLRSNLHGCHVRVYDVQYSPIGESRIDGGLAWRPLKEMEPEPQTHILAKTIVLLCGYFIYKCLTL